MCITKIHMYANINSNICIDVQTRHLITAKINNQIEIIRKNTHTVAHTSTCGAIASAK